MTTVIDQAQRQQALEPRGSFIVQAPAGAGKTAILIRRYLRLLASVDAPEKIIAITFTRKAAAEMRSRVLQALELAESATPPTKEVDRELWQLARDALAQDRALDWRLHLNPNRMRIMTIDALTARLVRMMPVLSGSGGAMSPIDDAKELYREAARATLLGVNEAVAWQAQAAALLAHLDNDFQRAEGLLADMLGKRDQWLPLLHLPQAQSGRQLLESTLQQIVTDALQHLLNRNAALFNSCIPLAIFSAEQLQAEGKNDHRWACFQQDTTPLTANLHDLPRWQALADLLITQNGTLRKSITKTIGFPTSHKDEKAKLQDLLGAIAIDPHLHTAVLQLPFLPKPHYSDADWRLLAVLIDLLKIAVAQLQVLFAERGEVDHIEVTQAAITALGEDDNPTDLALLLDHHIQHLLIDEFQDTSQTHFSLLRKLTAGWQQGDGRTLFCVGDPMQSIYRFREAEVGLFLTVMRQGLGTVLPESLQLAVNFRSSATVIDWINTQFSACFPQANDSAIGAVSYAPAFAYHEDQEQARVQLHAFDNASLDEEAAAVLAIVQESLQQYPQQSLAILVRSRSHLQRILPSLRDAGIAFHALESERLADLPVIRDLQALVLAMHHFGDRLAWFSVLRAPWCGLLLSDLTALATAIPQGPLWPQLQQLPSNTVSEDGQLRLQHVIRHLQTATAPSAQNSLRQRVETLWLALGGRNSIASARDLLAVERFFALLEKLDQAGRLQSADALEKGLDELFAPPDPDPRAHQVQILTIHKAKGLEFDTVILPGLGRKPRSNSKELLQMLRYTNNAGQEQLLLTTLEASGQASGSISKWIGYMDEQRESHERQRLLYVAATRAKQRLHLLGHVQVSKKKEEPKPQKHSLLAELWPAVKTAFLAQLPEPADDDDAEIARSVFVPPPLQRISTAALQKIMQVDARKATTEEQPPALPDFFWAGMLARQIGTVVHTLLQQIAEDGLSHWSAEVVANKLPLYRSLLRVEGVTDAMLEQASLRVMHALQHTLEDERGRWILSAHQAARCEYALTLRDTECGMRNLIMDRTFIDEQGQRWIVDYKTGSHQDASTLDAFLDNEAARYQAQLHQYWHAMHARDGSNARLALYFPMLAAWREIAAPL